MKQYLFLFFILICSYTTYSQNHFKEGDKCFEEGDYTCAETKYKELYKSASELDMQFGEIKIQRAKLCKDNLKLANQEFVSLNYAKAKEKYQAVLDSNPKDVYAKSQIDKCDTKINEAETIRLNKNNPISNPSSYPTTTPVQSSSQVAKSTIKTNILKSEAKMRKLDSPLSNTIYTLPTGTQVNILGLTTGGYYKVEYNGKVGYINEMYFTNSEIKESTTNQITPYSPEPTSSRKGKDRQKLSSFSSLGFQSGEIAKYGLIYERGGRKTVGFRFSARTSLTSQDDILNGKVTENKTEIELGPNFKLGNRVYFNIGIGYGFYDRLSNNDYVGRNYIEKTGYSVATTGIMIRLSRVVSINGGVSFMDLEKDLYKPEITFGIAFNLKSRWKS
nr:SH3 domain-containing protein [uncultured Flavobacterium sp.]